MHDIVIRGGSIVDGTGAPASQGDVAIDGDRIVQVGGKAGPGRREVKAEGRIVTPGWVDVHTHYDGQATWDPVLAPSSWHGATTIAFGNCGVGFAPVRQQHQKALIDLMEGVEDIPGITLTEGLKWDWESFPDYLDALARLPRTIDVAAQIAHHPLRVYAMGERAIARERATAEDIEVMARLTEDPARPGTLRLLLASGESVAEPNRYGRPPTPSTLHRIRATLRSALNAAIREGLLRDNPARHVEVALTAAPARPGLDRATCRAMAEDRRVAVGRGVDNRADRHLPRPRRDRPPRGDVVADRPAWPASR